MPLATKGTLGFFSSFFSTRLVQTETFKNIWHMRTYKNTKGEINNRSFVATPCQKSVGVFQELGSSFRTILSTHDQHPCPFLSDFFPSFFCLGLEARWCHRRQLKEMQKPDRWELGHIKLYRGLLNDVPIVQCVNIGVGEWNLAMLVGSCSIAHKMPYDLWPPPQGMVSYPHLWLQHKLHNTITTAIVAEWPHWT